MWAIATLASSRSSRMIGSRIVLAWIMIVGTVIGIPFGLAVGIPTDVAPEAYALLLVAGLSYAGGLYTAYTALTIGKVSIVAPIVATEGADAALLAVALGDPLAAGAGLVLGMIVAGVVLSSLETARPDVLAGDIEIAADALEGPALVTDTDAGFGDGPLVPTASVAPGDVDHTQRAVILSIIAAFIFGVGLVATGKAAEQVPPIWVAIAVRLVGLIVVALPVILQRRLVLTRAALPLVLIAGTGEIIGSTLSAWGASDNIAIAAVLGSQFAAIAAVMAYLLFGERLSRTQVAGVVLIVVGVTALAAVSA
jgi:drug/metabolite transporter (DMT)-like permease